MDHSPSEETHDIVAWKQWGLLIASLGIIAVSVEGLVKAAIGLGDVLGTSSFVWGLTVIAAGTSLPDAFVSIKAAKEGKGVVTLSNVLGSNIFDLLVAIPAGILIAGTASIDFARAVPMMGVLVLATVLLLTFLRTDFHLSHTESYILLGTYAVFVIWLILETVGITGLIP